MISKYWRGRAFTRFAAALLAFLISVSAASCAALPFPASVTEPPPPERETAEITAADSESAEETTVAEIQPEAGAQTTTARADPVRPTRVTQAETTDRLLTPEYQEYAARFSEKNQQCSWMEAEAARQMFNNAVEAWSWFYLTTAPLYGPYLDEHCHQRVDLPGITTYEGLRKYLRNFFTAEITDSIMRIRTDYVDIDGELCAIQADRPSDPHYGKITDYYFHFTGFSTAEFIVTVEHFDDSGAPDGSETFTVQMEMDARPYWHITDFPIWM